MGYVTFENNGRPFTFNDNYCGGGKHLMIDYSSVVAIQLKVDNTKLTQNGAIGFLKNAISKISPKYVIQID